MEERLLLTRFEDAQNWARKNAIWPLGFGLACCAIEMITVIGSPRNDLSRFGAEVIRFSPRQADMLILSGRVSIKMAPIIRRIYDQMLEPKWVISMGACASSAGMFNNYALVAGADKFLPIDVYVPGCPPRPEALIYGIMKLQDKIMKDPSWGWRERYGSHGHRGGRAQRRPPSDGVRGRPRCLTRQGWSSWPSACATGVADDAVVGHRLLARPRPRWRWRRTRCTTCWPSSRDRDEEPYGFLASLHGCDYLPEEPRLGVHYQLLSMERAERLCVKTRLSTVDSRVPTVIDLFPTANFHEREVYDFFGVRVRGPPRHAPDPDARGLRGPPPAARLPDGRRAGPVHLQRARAAALV